MANALNDTSKSVLHSGDQQSKSNLGRNLMSTTGLELVQKGRVLGNFGEEISDSADEVH